MKVWAIGSLTAFTVLRFEEFERILGDQQNCLLMHGADTPRRLAGDWEEG